MSVSDVTIFDLVKGMGEGNPGALDVLVRIAKRPDRELLLAELIRQNRGGSAIWMLYKDEHGENLEAMCVALFAQSKARAGTAEGE